MRPFVRTVVLCSVLLAALCVERTAAIEEDYYKLLGVSRDASAAKVGQAL